jgi:predicted kinase
MNAQNVTLLIGPPCSGKSTYITTQNFDYVVSSDNIVTQICEEKNIPYGDFFNFNFNHHLRKLQRKRFEKSIKESKEYKNIVWDLTNLTRKNRQHAMSFYKEVEFHAIEFSFKGMEQKIIGINKKRGIQTGKFISVKSLSNMFNAFESPTKNEGFISLVIIDQVAAMPN